MSCNLEAEYNEHEKEDAWLDLFIKIDSSSVRHSKNEAMKDENYELNRYMNVAPFDQSRVKLQRIAHDYINASLIEVPQANRRYILTQGPLAKTIAHFWLMIWEQDSRAIVMLNKLIEKYATKCEFYWPEGKGDKGTLELEDVQLTVKFVASHKRRKNFLIREFLLTDHASNQSRTINQYHYTEWPDFGQPDSPVSFLKLLSSVRSSGGLDDHGPAVVHCSAGIGRSGTFCLIDSVLLMIENKRSTKDIDISDILLEMRKHRAGLIQTPDQLRFSYKAIIYGTKLLNISSDSASTSQQSIHSKSHTRASEGSNNPSNTTSKSTKRTKASIDGTQSLVEALNNIDSDDDGMTLLDNSAQIEPPHVKIAKQSTHHYLGSPPPSSSSNVRTKLGASFEEDSIEVSNKSSKQNKNTQQKKSSTRDLRPSNLTLNSDVIPDITPLPSPGNVMNQPLLGQKLYSEASKNLSSGTNILQRRRERELRNQRLAERTKNIRDNMRNNEGRAAGRARNLEYLKKAGAACGIAAVVFYLYYKNYFYN